MEKEKICIGEYGRSLKYNFSNHLNDIRATFTPECIGIYGLEFKTEILRDLLSGGKASSTALLDRMNDDLLNDKSLPVFRKEKERVYKELLEDFETLCKTMKRMADRFPYVLPEYYYIVENTNFIDVLPNAFEAIDEAGRIYIDNPETIAVYKQSVKVKEEFDKLRAMAEKYYCYPIGLRGILSFDTKDNTVEINTSVIVECHQNGVWKRMYDK